MNRCNAVNMNDVLFLLMLFLVTNINSYAQFGEPQKFNLRMYTPAADGKRDDTEAFKKLFEQAAQAEQCTITIPPGKYYLSGKEAILLSTGTHVFAYGARFYLPEELGDRARIVLFKGTDLTDFSWHGGHFQGYVFDHLNPPNTWEPNASTRIFVVKTTSGGRTDRLTFRDIHADRIGGAVINVEGYKLSESEVGTFATNISIENCVLKKSGKFMWDYGLLWQIMVFPEDYSLDYQQMAEKYYENELIHPVSQFKESDDRIQFNNTDPETNGLIVSQGEIVCLFNDALPDNITRGKRYYVLESDPSYIKISEIPYGPPIRFSSPSGKNVKLITKLRRAFMRFAPMGEGPGKGSIDLVGCKNTSVIGCKISSLGDAMHIHSSHNNTFSNNHITGSRMGAFFLAEFCKNSTITANTINGTNGSRVMSIEKSNEDVVVTGNTFRNGGRGSWINQPKNLIITNNIFINNTTKGEKDPWRGRRDYKTGQWQEFAEIYFTTWEEDGSYGPVILKDNIFITGPEAAAAVQFEKNGNEIFVEGNIFKVGTGKIFLDESDTTIFIKNNHGALIHKGASYSESKYGN